MKSFLLSVCFLVSFCVAQAAEGSFFITGMVADSVSGSAVELATISLTRPADGKIVSVTTAGPDGKFSMSKVESGDYIVTVTFVGYNSKALPVTISGDKDMGSIQLSTSAKVLDAATIITEKSLITKTAEKTVYNVAQSPINQSGSAEDVLRNMPGVSIDQRGNVSVAGKDGVNVLVDGKPDAMASANLQNFLKSIPANSIEAIELITNPSAKYDAEGNAGIINIKLKKGKADGFNGSVMFGYGYPNRYIGSASVNYKKKKFNLFALYSLDAIKTRNRFIEDRKISLGDTSFYHMDSKGRESHMNNSLKAGMDYYINDKNTITFKAGFSPARMSWFSDANSQRLDANREITSSYLSTNDDKVRFSSISGGVDYRKKFDSTDHELSAVLNYTYLFGGGDTYLKSLGYDSTGVYSDIMSLRQRTQSRFKINNAVAQVDYVKPLKWAGYKIEAGLKDELTRNESLFNVYRQVNNQEQRDSLRSNDFKYTENISAAYIMFNGAYNKLLSYTGGLRAEHTYMNSNDPSVNRNYISWFPSASVNFSFGDAHSLSTSYSRRVQRPQFRQISNSVIFIDQYSTWQGNPAIQPSFSNIVSINYTLMLKQHMFSWEAMGNFQTAGFIESSRIDSAGITRGGFYNGANSKVFNFTFYAKLKLTKWWELQVNQVYMYSFYSFQRDINTRSFQGSAYNLWVSTNFKFWKNTILEVNGWMNTGGVHSQGDALPVGTLNASIKKSFFKDKLTVAIGGRNVLNTMKWRWSVFNTNLETNGSWQQIDRNVSCTITYRFGSGKPVMRRMEENERLGGGGGGGGR